MKPLRLRVVVRNALTKNANVTAIMNHGIRNACQNVTLKKQEVAQGHVFARQAIQGLTVFALLINS